jgi:Amt family ammonium transporter
MVWAVVLSFVVFGILKVTIGLRVTEEEEMEGLDVSEHGSLAYPGKRTRE